MSVRDGAATLPACIASVRAQTHEDWELLIRDDGSRDATAPFFARMDADDVCFPERLERQLAHLDAHPAVDLVGSSTRMSTDPGDGVVDPDCRVHGTDKLYVAGSSVFPTGSCANPTFTIVALAHRLADHLADRPR